MQPRFVALAVLAVALIGCDAVATSTTQITPTGAAASAAAASGAAGTGAGTAAPASSAPAATAAPPAATSAPTVAPRTNPPPPPPASAAKVTVLPANSGPLGSTWLLSVTGFPVGRITETVTDPRGIPKSQFVNAGPDGSASVTFQTSLTDQPGVGRYTFRFDSGATSVTAAIEVTRPQ